MWHNILTNGELLLLSVYFLFFIFEKQILYLGILHFSRRSRISPTRPPPLPTSPYLYTSRCPSWTLLHLLLLLLPERYNSICSSLPWIPLPSVPPKTFNSIDPSKNTDLTQPSPCWLNPLPIRLHNYGFCNSKTHLLLPQHLLDSFPQPEAENDPLLNRQIPQVLPLSGARWSLKIPPSTLLHWCIEGGHPDIEPGGRGALSSSTAGTRGRARCPRGEVRQEEAGGEVRCPEHGDLRVPVLRVQVRRVGRGPVIPHPSWTALRKDPGRLEVPDLRGSQELLREQERGDCGVRAEPAVRARRQRPDIGPEGLVDIREPVLLLPPLLVGLLLAIVVSSCSCWERVFMKDGCNNVCR